MLEQGNEPQIKYRLCWRDRESCEYGYSAWMNDSVWAWELLFHSPATWERIYWLEARRASP
ncbi:hypothetical protein [Nitrosococcus watsonii]|uniref:hypothetical protein n=1 Tax=Nitrosococcus watsonii TaxID=473531 RepID=UPI0012F8B648|nr:hypothetical protein [Nitrosococcus watsonii]